MKFVLAYDGEPKPASSNAEWAHEFENTNRRVASTATGDFWLSTVFLGLAEDHIWETMLFQWGEEIDRETCGGSRADAIAMHERMRVKHNLL